MFLEMQLHLIYRVTSSKIYNNLVGKILDWPISLKAFPIQYASLTIKDFITLAMYRFT